MTQLPVLYDAEPVEAPPPPGVSGLHAYLPGDILAERASLLDTAHRAEGIKTEADGKWLGGFVGWDGLTGLIPGVGAAYTSITYFRLLGCANSARCSFGTKLIGFVICAIDIAIGVLIGVGDVLDFFFRSGAIFAGNIQSDIRRKLILIDTAEQQIAERGHLTDADVTRLRDALFRGGYRQGSLRPGHWVALLLILFVLIGLFG